MGTGTTLVFAHLKNTCRLCSHRGHKDRFCERRDKDNTTITNMATSRGKTHHKKTGHFRKSTWNSIFATFKVNFEDRRKYIVVLINKRLVKFPFDTASDITLISRSPWELLGKSTLKDSTHVACNALGKRIQLTGELICDVSFKEKKIRCVLHYGLFLVWILLKNLTFLRFPWTQFLIPAKLILQHILINILWAYWKLNLTMFFKKVSDVVQKLKLPWN